MRSKLKRFVAATAATAASIALLRKLRRSIDPAAEPYNESIDTNPDPQMLTPEDDESADLDVDDAVFEEGDERVELDTLAYAAVVDEYGTDASIKSNTLDKAGTDRFDDEEAGGYTPTLQVTAGSRFILQTGTAGTITKDTIDTFVEFRESGYRRLLFVPDDDVDAVEDLVADLDASVTVCSPETLDDEL